MIISLVQEDGKAHIRYKMRGKKGIHIWIHSFIRSILKDLYNEPCTTLIAHEYIDDKGLTEEVYNLVKELHKTIHESGIPPQDILMRFIELLPYDDLYEWVQRSYKASSALVDEVNKDEVKNGRISLAQTYTKDEYIRLLPLIMLIKVASPILNLEFDVNAVNYPGNIEQLITSSAYKSLPGYSPIVDRVLEFITKHIDTKPDDKNPVCDKLNIAVSSLPEYTLGRGLLSTLIYFPIYVNPTGEDVIKALYRLVTNTLQIKSSISIKKVGRPSTDTGDPESRAEAYWNTTNINAGEVETYNLFTDDLEVIQNTMDEHFTDEEIEEAVKLSQPLLEKNYGTRKTLAPISVFSIRLASLLISERYIPGSLENINRENIVNIFVFSYLKLKRMGYDELAKYMFITPNTNTLTNIPPNIKSIPSNLKDKLNSIYMMKDAHNHILALTDIIRVGNMMFPNKETASEYGTMRVDIANLCIDLYGG